MRDPQTQFSHKNFFFFWRNLPQELGIELPFSYNVSKTFRPSYRVSGDSSDPDEHQQTAG